STNSDVWATPSRDATPPPSNGDAAGRSAGSSSGPGVGGTRNPAQDGVSATSGVDVDQEDDLAARLRFDPDAGRPSWYRPPRTDRPASGGSNPPPRRSAPPRPARPPAPVARPARPARPPSPGRRARGRRTHGKIALPVLAGLIVAAVALVGAIVGLT